MKNSMTRLAKYSVYKKTKRKKKAKKGSSSRVVRRANKLNKNVPKSEQWFRKKFEAERVFDVKDVTYNKPIGNYIVDVFLKKLNLIIEVDGSIHDSDEQKFKDFIRQGRLMKRGHLVVRVKAYDEESYQKCILAIAKLGDMDV